MMQYSFIPECQPLRQISSRITAPGATCPARQPRGQTENYHCDVAVLILAWPCRPECRPRRQVSLISDMSGGLSRASTVRARTVVFFVLIPVGSSSPRRSPKTSTARAGSYYMKVMDSCHPVVSLVPSVDRSGSFNLALWRVIFVEQADAQAHLSRASTAQAGSIIPRAEEEAHLSRASTARVDLIIFGASPNLLYIPSVNRSGRFHLRTVGLRAPNVSPSGRKLSRGAT